MQQIFLIAFREAAQCVLLLSLLLLFPPIINNNKYYGSLTAGAAAAVIAGFLIGFNLFMSSSMPSNETWAFWRHVSEAAIFYSGLALLIVRPKVSSTLIYSGLFTIGFFLIFFESREVGFLTLDSAELSDNSAGIIISAIAGFFAGAALLLPVIRFIRKIARNIISILPGFLMLVGAWKFISGGTGELEKTGFFMALQTGIMNFLDRAVGHLQSALLITRHSFINAPFEGLAVFLSGDRMAMTLAFIFFIIPPVFMLLYLFARPDPIASEINTRAYNRLSAAFFRKSLAYEAAPALAAFIMLLVMMHMVNLSANPLYEPVPMPVKEIEGRQAVKLPLSDSLGHFTDKKLRKYVYYYGHKQIFFIAILKPDGSVGVALDECEICRPADWNKDAQGYAQRGENLICKYCVTPIPVASVNSPGGCNPIPLPFTMDDENIIIAVSDLIRLYNEVRALEKKGSHF